MKRLRRTSPARRVLIALMLIAVLATCVSVAFAADGGGMTISTFAGNGATTPRTESLAATSSGLPGPEGVAVAADGSVLISDYSASTVRRVVNGVINTVPGASTANLVGPRGIAVYSGGFYVADADRGVVLKFPDGGSPSIVLGNGVKGVSLSQPTGLAIDTSGSLYVADTKNHRIIKLTTSGTASVFAGGTKGTSDGEGTAVTASFEYPEGVAWGNGSLYIADSGSNRIRKVTGSQINTIAGTTTAGFADGVTIGGARLNDPSDLVYQGGSVYIADRGNARIRKITGTTLSTIAGTGTTTFNETAGQAATSGNLKQPTGIAVAPDGRVFVADPGHLRVRLLTPAAPPVTPPTETTPTETTPTQTTPTETTPTGTTPTGTTPTETVPTSPPGPQPVGDASGPAAASPSPDTTARASQPELGGAQPIGRASHLPAPAAPAVGRRAAVQPYGGVVQIKLPGGRHYVPLDGNASIPMGATVDTRHGQVRLTSAANAHGRRQTAVLRDGVFKLSQRKSKRPMTVLKMTGQLPRCPAARTSTYARAGIAKRARRRAKDRRLWGRGHGHFRTVGHYGAGTVRGTIWGVIDTCGGTTVRVKRGLVQVSDFVAHRRVMVPKGHQYFARRR